MNAQIRQKYFEKHAFLSCKKYDLVTGDLTYFFSIVTVSLKSYFFSKSNVTHPEMHIRKVWSKNHTFGMQGTHFFKIRMTNLCFNWK